MDDVIRLGDEVSEGDVIREGDDEMRSPSHTHLPPQGGGLQQPHQLYARINHTTNTSKIV